MCLARSTPHTGSSGAQGLWSEFTAKPQLAAPKGSTGPLLVIQLALTRLARVARSRYLQVHPVHQKPQNVKRLWTEEEDNALR